MEAQLMLKVNAIDAGRIIDALSIRAEAWNRTASSLLNSNVSDEITLLEDTDDPSEALAIAREYVRLKLSIESQLPSSILADADSIP